MKSRGAFVVAVLAAAIGSSAFAQQAPERLGDQYAKTALVALFAIHADTSMPVVQGGELLVVTRTQEKIDAADAEARSASEIAMTKGLRSIYVHRLTNNMQLKPGADDPVNSLAAGVVRIKKQETACFDSMERALRARSTKIPAACMERYREIANPAPAKAFGPIPLGNH